MHNCFRSIGSMHIATITPCGLGVGTVTSLLGVTIFFTLKHSWTSRKRIENPPVTNCGFVYFLFTCVVGLIPWPCLVNILSACQPRGTIAGRRMIKMFCPQDTFMKSSGKIEWSLINGEA